MATDQPSSDARREWTPEEQKEVDRTVRALSLASILEWESVNDNLVRPGRRLVDPPAPAEPESSS